MISILPKIKAQKKNEENAPIQWKKNGCWFSTIVRVSLSVPNGCNNLGSMLLIIPVIVENPETNETAVIPIKAVIIELVNAKGNFFPMLCRKGMFFLYFFKPRWIINNANTAEDKRRP